MRVFSSSGDTRSVVAWGPTASVNVRVAALGGVIDNTWLLTGFQIGAREIVDVRQCFNDVSYIYALGNDQSSCAITLVFTVFIGTKNCSGASMTSSIGSGLGAYVKSRISKKTSPSSITIGSFSKMGWLVGVDIGQPDPAKGTCVGTVSFIMELG